VDLWTYIFGKPGELRRDLGMMNTSPERVLVAGFLAIVIGLTSNLWGQTEFLIDLIPAAGQQAVNLHLDSIYAVGGLRAYYGDEYEARYPREWLFDQRVALAKFGQTNPDDIYTSRGKRPKGPLGISPDAAWGPPGGGQRPVKERENLSVVRQLLPPKPTGAPADIETILQDPDASLTKMLSETIAPAGSKKKAVPLRAERRSKVARGQTNIYYEYEWRTSFDAGFSRRTYSSAALGPPDAQGRRYLYTLALVLPEDEVLKATGVVEQVPRIIQDFYVKSS